MRLRKPTLRELRRLIPALCWTAIVRAGLSLTSFRSLVRGLRRFRPEGRARTSASLEELVWSVGAAARLIPGANTCLPKALVADLILARHGFDASLRIGATKSPEGALEAHAWVESDGRVVLGGQASPTRFEKLQPAAGASNRDLWDLLA